MRRALSLSAVILLLWVGLALAATEVICIVDTDPDAEDAHYHSLADAIAGETGASPKCVTSADLVANDEQLTIECRASSGAADTAAVSVDGFTQDEDRYVEIYIPPAHRHNGKWSTGKYRIESTAQDILYIKDSYTRVRGIQVKGSSSQGWYNRTVRIDEDTDYVVFEDFIIINDCQFEAVGPHAVGFSAIGKYGEDKHDRVQNGIIICKNYTGRGFYAGSWNSKLFNVTIYGGKYGIVSEWAKTQFTNIVAVGASVSCFYDKAGGFSTSSDYNASDDGTAPGANSIDLTGVSLGTIFTDYSNEDFSLVSNSPLIDAGTDLSASMDSVDIIGTSRPQGDYWDIGAFELSGPKWNGITPAKWNGVDWSNIKWNGM